MKPLPLALVLIFFVATPGAHAAERALDDGRLEPGWFGAGIELREADEIDYLWVKTGFTFEGQKVWFAPWEETVWLGENAADRDSKDKRLAKDLERDLPELFAEAFRNAFGARLTVGEADARVRAVGRIVDCSTGSAAAKFWVGMGAGAGSTTFDLKFVDAKSGELLVAIHHRVVSGTSLSTTDSKLVKWIDEFAGAAAKKGIETLYRRGDRVRK
jgi:hypothetical protein